ncbi:UTP--glucose-1-phosphate uridylyltransferase GalU [Salidesulfovibrio onnuriiensis]|uniref:UTP--glucose-1-phosphate uridylyltransferase GalU n=1 Tax=Salidesulfovibrio onnuriiensis TaxID=2583823 RepID=UPI0011CC1D86|nr:UTP--glucose-1-phosphate uridylyltransferase GalU [Salidesulfovibrio onnuriiensis]
MDIRKAVIPVAGWGTRSLPATKNIPKEMLPIYKKPIVQYIVEEAIGAGLQDVVFVTNQNKKIIEDHFDRSFLLEQLLERGGKMQLLKEVRQVADMCNMISVRQKEQLGLGHAVLCAKEVCKNEPFAVMLGDDLMFGMNAGIIELLDAARTEGKAVVGVIDVPREKVNRYGIIQGEEFAPNLFRVRNLVEKPKPEEAPSTLAITGRYVLLPEIFDILENQEPGVGGEIQLTDALQGLADQDKLIAVKLQGQRFDAGDWVEYLTANIYFALHDEELHDDLVKRLMELLPCTDLNKK